MCFEFYEICSCRNKLAKEMMIIKGHFFSNLKIYTKCKPSPNCIYITFFFLKHYGKNKLKNNTPLR